MWKDKLLVEYTCNLCGIVRAKVALPYRDEKEPITDWMEIHVMTAVARDHDIRSPNCPAKKISELWIPTVGVQWIGGPPIE